MTTYKTAEAFPPGDFLREELEERGWSQLDFASITGKDTRTISEVINGKRSITPETALAFAKALGTSAELWLNLESQYRLWWLARADDDQDAEIARRARLYTFPIREMSRRGWIDDTASLDALERQLAVFFNAVSLDDIPHLDHAARRTGESKLNPAQLAWLFRAKHLAEALSVPTYSNTKLKTAIESLRTLLHGPEETKQVPAILSNAGVRYVIVEGLPSNKIDGVCFWLNRDVPVIAMTLRHDRIDNFWFVLRHEIEHVLRGDGKGKELVEIEPDSELGGAVSYETSGEKTANEAAANFCVARDRMDDCVARVGPYYAKAKIEVFAEAIGVHPGLVVGQLHKRGVLSYKNLRKFLVHVRGFITETALTDGWGMVPPVQRS